VFGERIRKISATRTVIHQKLLLPDTITNPVETHVHSFGTFLLDGVVGETFGSGVVHLHGGGWLGVLELSEGGAKRDGLLAIDVGATNFRLRSGSDNNVEDFANSENGSIQRRANQRRHVRVSGGVAEEEMTAGTTARPGLG
jgi:hypothetical protein